MNDTTYNAIAEAKIVFFDFTFDDECKRTPRNEKFFEDYHAHKFAGVVEFIRIWHFDLVDHFTRLFRDEFGILSLESCLESTELNPSWQEYRIQVYTDKLLQYLADAIAQELKIEKPFYIICRNNEIHIAGSPDDFDKFARVNDMTDEILARADYLGAMNAVKVAVCFKSPKAA